MSYWWTLVKTDANRNKKAEDVELCFSKTLVSTYKPTQCHHQKTNIVKGKYPGPTKHWILVIHHIASDYCTTSHNIITIIIIIRLIIIILSKTASQTCLFPFNAYEVCQRFYFVTDGNSKCILRIFLREVV